jgi:uncharacterized membrane protein HdeD (DUF308 family)
MALLAWTPVAFGVGIALTGSWIQLHPERILPRPVERWRLDPAALAQIRLLGACFLFMGVFFALQMTTNLKRLPWWMGTLSGLGASIATVALVDAQVRRQQRRSTTIQRSPMAEKTLELR